MSFCGKARWLGLSTLGCVVLEACASTTVERRPRFESEEAEVFHSARSTLADGSTETDQLSDEDVLLVLRAHKVDINSCRAQHPTPDGVVGMLTVELVVLGTGHISQVRVQPPEARELPVASCVTESVRRWIFPSFAGRPLSMDFAVKIGPPEPPMHIRYR